MQKIVIANWKANKTPAEVVEWLEGFEKGLQATQGQLAETELKIILAPSFISLQQVGSWISEHASQLPISIALASQDISPFPAGSYTGAIATPLLSGIPVEYAIVGHSERRQYFHETDQEVANKVHELLAAEITPIVCVDDPYVQSMANVLEAEQREQCLVAYEALDAIGSGNNVPAEKVAAIKTEVEQAFGAVPYLYGGSVKASNVTEYDDVVVGYLIGGASLQPDSFIDLLLALSKK